MSKFNLENLSDYLKARLFEDPVAWEKCLDKLEEEDEN